MITDPPVDYLAKFSDKELYDLWEKRTARLRKATKEARTHKYLWPVSVPFWEEEVDRVEKEMAKRNLPVPGEDTFHA
jgi:hypothetical protein